MADGFGELGLSSAVLSSLQELGFTRPTSIQRSAIPVIRRGGNVLIHAGTGAGATAAYGLALVDRLYEAGSAGEPTQVLVITATEERAAAAALELGRIGRAAGVHAALRAPAWRNESAIVVVPISRILPLVESSSLKLDSVKALVIEDLSTLLALGEERTLDTLLPTVPRDAQRIFITAERNALIEKIAEAHARKALHIPARPAVPDEAPATSTPTSTVEYRVVAAGQVVDEVASLISRNEKTTVFCRTQALADRLRDELGLRGITAEPRLYGESGAGGSTIGCGAPFDAETASAAFADGGVVLIEPRELPHLRQVGKQANFALRSGRARASASSGVERFRTQIRRALEEEDIDAQLLVLEPLLNEFSPAEVAGAVTALLRKRPAAPAAQPEARAPSSAGAAFVKLFISIGTRDGIATRELVGAITGEAGISGDQIGRVDVRETFSIVEVAAEGADKVIRALNGTSLRGRALRVDYDRRGAAGGGARRPPQRARRP